jgi:hypothetical protein
LMAAAREEGVVRRLEFGLPRMVGPVQSDHLPTSLLALAGRYRLDIVLSHYPVDPAGGARRTGARKRPRKVSTDAAK